MHLLSLFKQIEQKALLNYYKLVCLSLFESNGPKPASLFVLSSSFSHDKYCTNINEKSVDCVLGTRTCGSRMVGRLLLVSRL